ncbi:receptor-like protein EIX2 [Senna tora]|uniref:Receptor-like protein EIX2 n=1 Tax=Senna tora TaxID=362788 RepID=A0A834T0E8_9FABA|nr:receptor-like protein EIX2 [Senna tora]
MSIVAIIPPDPSRKGCVRWIPSKDDNFPLMEKYLQTTIGFTATFLVMPCVLNAGKRKKLLCMVARLQSNFEFVAVPPFQLDKIFLISCKLGPNFPKWLQTQTNFSILEISNTGISDMAPQWFWGLLTPNLLWLNVSYNNLWGTIPNFPVGFIGSPNISLAFNRFEGSVPSFLRSASIVDLSNNKFSESLTFLCDNTSAEALAMLDISSNQFSGQLSDCWTSFTSLIYLDLSNNNLSWEILPSIGSLLGLQALIIRNNSLIGELPLSLKSCTSLKMLDVGKNRLSGSIPSWIGEELQQLQMLSL